jgi:hypothetical protein
LDTHEHHHARAGLLDHAREPLRADAGVRFVVRMDLNLDFVAENASLFAIPRQPVERRE